LGLGGGGGLSSRGDGSSASHAKVVVKPDAFLSFHALHRGWYARLEAAARSEADATTPGPSPPSSPWLFVTTEDLLRGGEASADALREILRHINVTDAAGDDRRAGAHFFNLSYDPYGGRGVSLRDKIANYDELRAALRSSPKTRHLAPPP